MKRTKSTLRETLDALTATLVAGILAAARESLLEMHAEAKPEVAPRKQRAPRRTGLQRRARTVDSERASDEDETLAPASEAPNGLVITDPGALLAALETKGPAYAEEDAAPREEPEILRPVSAPAPERVFIPALRAGEEVMRAGSSAVVLRRRRV